jgi:hypothetical protein
MDKPGELPLIDIASGLQAKGVAVKMNGEGVDDDGVLKAEPKTSTSPNK